MVQYLKWFNPSVYDYLCPFIRNICYHRFLWLDSSIFFVNDDDDGSYIASHNAAAIVPELFQLELINVNIAPICGNNELFGSSFFNFQMNDETMIIKTKKNQIKKQNKNKTTKKIIQT